MGHMEHFKRISRRREILPCAEREQELLISFRIMREEMQLLCQRMTYFQTQVEDERHQQIFRNEIRETVIREQRRGRGPEDGNNNNDDGNSNNNNVCRRLNNT